MELTDVALLNGADARRGPAARRRGRGGDASIRSRRPSPRAARAEIGELPPSTGFRERAGRRRRRASSRDTRVEVGRRDGSIDRRVGRRRRARCSRSRDTVKPTSAEAIAELRALGLTPVLLTGDARETAERVAARGRHRPRARRGLPGRTRSPRSERLQDEGEVVAMVGDGDQRRTGARAGRPRPRDRHRHRRRDRGVRHDARLRRPPRRRRRDPPRAADPRARSRATSSGRSPTTSPRSRSRSRGC